MDFLTAVKVVIRRWYVFFPVLAVTSFLTLNVVKGVPPSYRAMGSVIVASPGAPQDTTGPVRAVNPLTNLDYSASVVASIVAGLMQDRAVKEDLVAAGANPDYTLGTPTGTNAPLLSVVSTAGTPMLAVNTVKLVIQGIQDQLERRQSDAGAPPETWIRAIVLTSPTEADRQSGGKVKAAGALGALSVLAATSMAFITESIGESRRRRAAERNAIPSPERLRSATDAAAEADRGTPAAS